MTDETEAATGTESAPQTGDTSASTETTATTETTTQTPAPAETAKWWEGKELNDAQRASITALGLTVDDPVQAVARLTDMEAAAKLKLGKTPDQLMDRPTEGQDVAEWLRANGKTLGIPEKPEGYEVKPPESWPEGATWDADFEAEARKIAHEEGLRGPALQRFTDLYAGKVAALTADAERDMAASNAQMQTALQTDWGDQYGAKVAMAQQAASVVAEAAGLDQAGLAGLAQVLKPKVGDAGTVRLFAAIGEMMAEDSLSGAGKGGNTLGSTPAEARAELARLQAKGGEWYEATAARDTANIDRLKPKMDQLRRLAAG